MVATRTGGRATARGARPTRAPLIALLSVLACQFSLPAAAAAQSMTGFATIFLGRGSGDHVTEDKWTPGGSMAISGESGLGSELDLWQLRDFDPTRFAESRVTAVMLNATGIWPDGRAIARPYVLGGVGILRSRICAFTCQQAVSTTALGLDAGGGAYFLWNEVLGGRLDLRYFRYLQRQDVLPLAADGGYFSFWRLSLGATVSWPIR